MTLRRLRHLSADDRAALAALQGASWRSAYRGVLPDAFLDAPAADAQGLAGRLSAEWAALTLAPDDLLLTHGPAEAATAEAAPAPDAPAPDAFAPDAFAPAAFAPAAFAPDAFAPDAFALVLADPAASATVAAEADPRPYLDHLHVRPDARGRGLGARLLRDAARRLAGHAGLWLWVFEANAGARRFYERLGAREELRAAQAPYGQPQPCLRLGWDAAGLAALAASPAREPGPAPH
ncbi:MAG: GNAT family N-acetyltransferase [Pseudomonadota bacterium]